MARIAFVLSLVLGVVSCSTVRADDDDDDDDDKHHERYRAEERGRGSATSPATTGPTARGVFPNTNAQVAKECGSCHFAYPAGLLPARSWTTLMGGLQDHFGDVAILDDADRDAVLAYLTANAADAAPGARLSARVASSVPAGQTPLRITEVPFIRHEHNELPKGVVGKDGKVASFAMCDSCHTGAAKGSFSESEINIPGLGRWDD